VSADRATVGDVIVGIVSESVGRAVNPLRSVAFVGARDVGTIGTGVDADGVEVVD